MARRRLIGNIVSDKMNKTRIVQTERFLEHPKYLRRIRRHKKYKAHDENQEYHAGDKVIIEEIRPLSKGKRWKIIQKI